MLPQLLLLLLPLLLLPLRPPFPLLRRRRRHNRRRLLLLLPTLLLRRRLSSRRRPPRASPAPSSAPASTAPAARARLRPRPRAGLAPKSPCCRGARAPSTTGEEEEEERFSLSAPLRRRKLRLLGGASGPWRWTRSSPRRAAGWPGSWRRSRGAGRGPRGRRRPVFGFFETERATARVEIDVLKTLFGLESVSLARKHKRRPTHCVDVARGSGGEQDLCARGAGWRGEAKQRRWRNRSFNLLAGAAALPPGLLPLLLADRGRGGVERRRRP